MKYKNNVRNQKLCNLVCIVAVYNITTTTFVPQFEMDDTQVLIHHILHQR